MGKTQGFKSDIPQTAQVSQVDGLSAIALKPKVSSKGTVMLQAQKGVRAFGYQAMAKVDIWVSGSKSDKWTDAQRAALVGALMLSQHTLGQYLSGDPSLERGVTSAVERENFSSAGGNLVLRGSCDCQVGGNPARIQIMVRFDGSRDWAETRPAPTAPAETK